MKCRPRTQRPVRMIEAVGNVFHKWKPGESFYSWLCAGGDAVRDDWKDMVGALEYLYLASARSDDFPMMVGVTFARACDGRLTLADGKRLYKSAAGLTIPSFVRVSDDIQAPVTMVMDMMTLFGCDRMQEHFAEYSRSKKPSSQEDTKSPESFDRAMLFAAIGLCPETTDGMRKDGADFLARRAADISAMVN